MTQEEKAKAYDKALERAKEQLEGAKVFDYKEGQIAHDIRTTTYAIFPELKESEDERIRTAIIHFISHTPTVPKGIIGKETMLVWLEKQGKQKEYTFKSIPRLLDMIEPSDKAKTYCQKLIDTLAKEGYNTDAKIVSEVLKGWNGEDVPMAVMDEQKPAWSEEDDKNLQGIIDEIEANKNTAPPYDPMYPQVTYDTNTKEIKD